jgi:hypothetical protein
MEKNPPWEVIVEPVHRSDNSMDSMMTILKKAQVPIDGVWPDEGWIAYLLVFGSHLDSSTAKRISGELLTNGVHTIITKDIRINEAN